MNIVRILRSQVGITQEQLAIKAGTSQPTIALYESESKSPTINTVKKMAFSFGLEMAVSFVPRMTREELRSLFYHYEIAKKLRKNPEKIIYRSKNTLNKLYKLHPNAKTLFDRWRVWLDLFIEELISKILDIGQLSRKMRHSSPFAGILNPRERTKILKQFRKEYSK